MSTETNTAVLVNISTEKWPPRHRTYFGSLEVRSPEPGEPYAITPVRGCTGVIDMGDKRMHEYRITAKEIAEDIAREINSDSGEGSFHGVFVAAGPEPTEAELADARRRLEEFQRRLVAAADLEWERTKNPMFITDLERRAARQLCLESPGSTIPNRWPNAPSARKRSSTAWPSAAPAAPSSTAKRPPSTVCCPQAAENANETKSRQAKRQWKQGSNDGEIP